MKCSVIVFANGDVRTLTKVLSEVGRRLSLSDRLAALVVVFEQGADPRLSVAAREFTGGKEPIRGMRFLEGVPPGRGVTKALELLAHQAFDYLVCRLECSEAWQYQRFMDLVTLLEDNGELLGYDAASFSRSLNPEVTDSAYCAYRWPLVRPVLSGLQLHDDAPNGLLRQVMLHHGQALRHRELPHPSLAPQLSHALDNTPGARPLAAAAK